MRIFYLNLKQNFLRNYSIRTKRYLFTTKAICKWAQSVEITIINLNCCVMCWVVLRMPKNSQISKWPILVHSTQLIPRNSLFRKPCENMARIWVNNTFAETKRWDKKKSINIKVIKHDVRAWKLEYYHCWFLSFFFSFFEFATRSNEIC